MIFKEDCMAYFRKIGDKWSAEIRIGDKKKSKRFTTKALAKQWASKMELGKHVISQRSKFTLADALMRYGREYTPKKKSVKAEINRIRKMRNWNIAKKNLMILPYKI